MSIKQFGMSMFEILNIPKVENQKKKRRNRKSKKGKVEKTNQLSILDLLTTSRSINVIDKPKNHAERGGYEQLNLFNLSAGNNTNSKSQVSFVDNIKSTIATAVRTVINKVKTITAESNYKITSKDIIGEGSLKQKCEDNIKAIETLKLIEKEKRTANKKEQSALIKYVGWGGLPQVFSQEPSNEWKEYAKQLKETLNDDEYKSTRATVLNAHYTPIAVIKAVYDIVNRLGFTGGKVLEPAMGIGLFFGLMPDKLRETTRLIGVEIDEITGRIAQQLYPDADIQVKGYEKTDIKDASIDLAIGNVPFGNYKVFDEKYNKLNLLIHDYFFIKTLDKVRAGGFIIFITSKGTMDKEDNKVRKLISDKADFIGAIRLPDTTFKKNANTEVTTDIIILQKRSENTSYGGSNWFSLTTNEDGIKINEYYNEHPELLMGKMGYSHKTYGDKKVTSLNYDGRDFEKSLHEAIKTLPKDIYVEPENDYYMFEENELLDADDYNIKDGAFIVIENKIYQRENSKLIPYSTNKPNESRIKFLIEIRDTILNILNIQEQSCTDNELKQAQNQLNSLYDEFIKKYGYISNRDNKRAFSDDPDYSLLCSLENLRIFKFEMDESFVMD